MKKGMQVRSGITELRRVLYDDFVEDNPLINHNLVLDDVFEFNQNGNSIQCKTHIAKGLHIAEVNLESSTSLTNTWITEKPHIRFFFYLKGHSKVKNGAGHENYSHRIGMLQRNFLDTHGGGGSILIEKDDQVHYVIIKMTLAFYLDLVKDEDWIETDTFHQYIISGKPENRPNETLYMDLGIFKLLQEILNHHNIIQHRYHFLRIKLKELLFVLFQKTNFAVSEPELPTSNVDGLERIKSHLLLHLENPPSSAELAKIFMLNERKLKQDFQKKYGTTIYGMVIQMRMEKAKQLLYENLNVNEIACFLGYNSVPHFIKVFKSYYGDTPKQFMMEINQLTAATQTSKP